MALRSRPPRGSRAAAGFAQTRREERPTTTVLTYEAVEPLPIDPDGLALGWRLYDPPPVLLDVP